ncbi:MAG: MBL fold metallo-hydrolase [Candidatus Taylorbacteria bacterium]|nr:MBL fold metallo-hydrolase [Candidatus Taylorbacteria bacterium]
MNIQKIGHCCLLVRTNTLTILTDPGNFSTDQNTVTGIDIVLITHEHGDHLHVSSLKEVLKNNPNAVVVTNTSVGKILDTEGMTYKVLEGRAKEVFQDVSVEAYDARHEEIYEEFGQVQNTGYFIDDRLFYPGDAFSVPEKPVEILALPVAGPWCKVSSAITYALTVKPVKAFPVHDGQLITERIGGSHKVPENILKRHGIEFIPMIPGSVIDF